MVCGESLTLSKLTSLKIHKNDQKSKWLITLSKLPMVCLPIMSRAAGEPWKCQGLKQQAEWDLGRMKERTEGQLGVRLGQVSQVLRNFFNEVIPHRFVFTIILRKFFDICDEVSFSVLSPSRFVEPKMSRPVSKMTNPSSKFPVWQKEGSVSFCHLILSYGA